MSAYDPDDFELNHGLTGLLEELPEAWAHVTAENEAEVAWAFIRAAYGSGYVTALGWSP